MSDPVDVLIQLALKAKLASPDLTTPATPIAWPLVAYTPATGTAYLQVHPIMKSPTLHPALAFAGSDLNYGIFQVDAVVPDGTGEAAGARLAGLVKDRFALGTELVAGSYTLLVNKVPQTTAPIKDAPWVRYPVSIPFLVIT